MHRIPLHSESDRAADQAARVLAQKPSFVFELEQSEEVQEFEFDLGTVKTSVDYVIEIKVASQLSGFVDFSKISTSCSSLRVLLKTLHWSTVRHRRLEYRSGHHRTQKSSAKRYRCLIASETYICKSSLVVNLNMR